MGGTNVLATATRVATSLSQRCIPQSLQELRDHLMAGVSRMNAVCGDVALPDRILSTGRSIEGRMHGGERNAGVGSAERNVAIHLIQVVLQHLEVVALRRTGFLRVGR